MSKLAYERMRDSLEQLHLERALESVDALLDRAGNGDLTTVDVLDQLLGAELAVRRERSIAMRLKLAGLPAVKTLEQFDFAFQPSLDEAKIRDLHTLRFLGQGQNVILLGPPGCGKTHLATSLGHAAITAGKWCTSRPPANSSRSCDARRVQTCNSVGSPPTALGCLSSMRSATSHSIILPQRTSSDSFANATSAVRSC